MANTIDFILTNAASELISKVLGGKTLNFTRMAVGDGFSYDTTVAKGYTALVNEVLSIDITKSETLSASSVKVTSAFKNTDAQKEFYYREVGLYAQDPDTGKEILYAYGNRNDAAELITPTGSSVVTKQLVFIISVGDSTNVTFNVNADVYALQEDMLNVQEDKADKNLVNTGMITNCLLEVPQRIKLELNNGVLTLKAGSVVIEPMGNGIFEHKIITQDITTTWTYNGEGAVFLNYNASYLFIIPITQISSGTTPPTTVEGEYWGWFDTTNQILKITGDGGKTWTKNLTLSLGVITSTTNGISSVNQVFNGMGYIGSTDWVDKGIIGLIPNGINTEGSLNNIYVKTQNIHIYTFDSAYNGKYIMSLFTDSEDNIYELYCKRDDCIYRQNNVPQDLNKWWYHISENQWKYIQSNGQIDTFRWLDVGECELLNGFIISLKPYKTFKAMNVSSDRQWLASLALPSEKYVNYELKTSGTNYTAPTNGWFAIRKIVGIATAGISCAVYNTNGTIEIYRQTIKNSVATDEVAIIIPILKGQVLQVTYDATGETKYFRFIYAQGEVD